jgi:hypothetical protein
VDGVVLTVEADAVIPRQAQHIGNGIRTHWLDQHHPTVAGQCSSGCAKRPNRIRHVMQAIEESDEIVLPAQLTCTGRLERDTVPDTRLGGM